MSEALYGVVNGAVDDAVYEAVYNVVHSDPTHPSIVTFRASVGAGGIVNTNWTVYWDVSQALEDAVYRAVYGTVDWAVYGTVNETVHGPVHGLMDWVVERAMFVSMCGDPPHPALPDFLAAVGAKTT